MNNFLFAFSEETAAVLTWEGTHFFNDAVYCKHVYIGAKSTFRKKLGLVYQKQPTYKSLNSETLQKIASQNGWWDSTEVQSDWS